MRLIFTSLASPGHTYPLLPLAVAARDAGHHVVFATSEDSLGTASRAGLETATAGIGIHSAFAAVRENDNRPPQDMPDAERNALVAKVFGDSVPRKFVADLGPLIDKVQPDLMINESGNMGGTLAAKLAGVPSARHSFGRMSAGSLGDAMREQFRGYATELGLDGEDVFAPTDPFIDVCPGTMQSAEIMEGANRVPIRPVGWNEPGELPSGIVGRDRSRPLIYLTLGTAFGKSEVLRTAIAGLASLDADVLVAAGPTVEVDTLGAIPANVRVEKWVPQANLLPHIDFVVHHGGSGTTLGALGAGIPQLLLPQGADQFTNSDSVLELGVGNRLVGDELTEDAITDTVRGLLKDPEVRAATERMAAEVAAMPTPAEVANQLPELAKF